MAPDNRRGNQRRWNDAMPPEIPFHGYPGSRAIMYLCITICVCICAAWYWSMGGMQTGSFWNDPPSFEQRQTLRMLNNHFTLKLADVNQGRWWTLITPAFSHVDLNHIVGNLTAFSTFSKILLESGIDSLRYGLLILGSAVSAHLAFLYHASHQRPLAWWWALLMPRAELQVLGLSGVVMGLGAALSLAVPAAKVNIPRSQSMPVWLLMVAYTIYDSSRLADFTSDVAHAGHLGGAAFGAVFYFLALRGRTALPFSWRLQG